MSTVLCAEPGFATSEQQLGGVAGSGPSPSETSCTVSLE